MIRAVFDANVLASGFLGLSRASSSVPAELLRFWMLGRFTLITSRAILDEVEFSAFASAYFQSILLADARADALAFLRDNAVVTDLTVTVQNVTPDPDDDHVLAAAISSAATYVVTGDQPFLSIGSYQGVDLVTPRQFLELLEFDQSADMGVGV